MLRGAEGHEYAEGLRPCSCGRSFVLLLINFEHILTKQQESPLSQCHSVMKLLVDPPDDWKESKAPWSRVEHITNDNGKKRVQLL